MRTKHTGMAIVMLTSLLLATIGCSDTLSRSFYRHHPRSLEAVEQVWGEPVDTVALDNGIEKRIYAIQTPYTDLQYRYFLIQDDHVLASGITDTGPVKSPKTQSDCVAFSVSTLSKAFYLRHPTTVDHLDTTWGAPFCVSDTDGGFQYRVYSVETPYADFRYRKFILKNGRVIASHLSPEQTCHVDAPQRVADIEINEISHRYYANHPMSLQEVETVWGTPVFVRESDKGLQKRVYRLQMPTDTAFAFRFFVIQEGMVVSSGITDSVGTTAN